MIHTQRHVYDDNLSPERIQSRKGLSKGLQSLGTTLLMSTIAHHTANIRPRARTHYYAARPQSNRTETTDIRRRRQDRTDRGGEEDKERDRVQSEAGRPGGRETLEVSTHLFKTELRDIRFGVAEHLCREPIPGVSETKMCPVALKARPFQSKRPKVGPLIRCFHLSLPNKALKISVETG